MGFDLRDRVKWQLPVSSFRGVAWIQRLGRIRFGPDVAVVATDRAEYVQETNHSDGTIRCRFKCGGATAEFAPSIVFRGADPLRYLLAQFSGSGKITLFEREGRRFRECSSATWNADTEWHETAVCLDDTSVTISVDGRQRIAYQATREVRGAEIGIRGYQRHNCADAFGDFSFEAPTDLEITPFPADYKTRVIDDTFSSADKTHLENRGWEELRGAWVAKDGCAHQLETEKPVEGYLVAQDAGSSDFAIEARIRTPSRGSFITGLAFRIQDAQHFIELELNNSRAYTGWAGFGCWWYANDGVFRPVMVKRFTPKNDTTYTIRVRTKGDLIIGECVEPKLIVAGSCSLYKRESKVGLFEARDSKRRGANKYERFVVRV